MKDGFRGASVDRIAAAAGVAKQTVYNHFPSKEALFEETIRTGVRDVVVELDDAPGNLPDRLVAYGHALRRKLLSPEGLAWFRALVGELPRLPELGRLIWREGPMETHRHLAEFIDGAMRRGELRQDDPALAAEMLNGMLIHYDRTRSLFAVVEPAPAAQRVEQIIACFMRAYQPDRGIQ